jgi:hypothetical protein
MIRPTSARQRNAAWRARMLLGLCCSRRASVLDRTLAPLVERTSRRSRIEHNVRAFTVSGKRTQGERATPPHLSGRSAALTVMVKECPDTGFQQAFMRSRWLAARRQATGGLPGPEMTSVAGPGACHVCPGEDGRCAPPAGRAEHGAVALWERCGCGRVGGERQPDRAIRGMGRDVSRAAPPRKEEHRAAVRRAEPGWDCGGPVSVVDCRS